MFIKRLWRRFKRYFIIYPSVYLAKWLIRILLATCKVEIKGLEPFIKLADQEKCIIMLWHNRLLILPEILQGYAPQFLYRAVISNSRDGEMLSILVHSYSFGNTLRVPHYARHKALGQMIRQLKNSREVLILTPDGPRGPRFIVKPGIAMAARVTGCSVIPLTWSVNKFWQLKTWDKMIVPKPFSRIQIIYGEPVYLTKDADREISKDTSTLQETLKSLDELVCESIAKDKNKWPM